MSETEDLKRRIDRIEERQDMLDERLADIANGISEIRVTLAENIALAPRVSALEGKVSILHDWHQQAIGLHQGVKAIWAVIGGLLTAAITWIAAQFSQMLGKHP